VQISLCDITTAHRGGLLFAVHKKGRFRGQERKNEPAVHKRAVFVDGSSGYLLYLHDLNENLN
jgi:hypothetical protein